MCRSFCFKNLLESNVQKAKQHVTHMYFIALCCYSCSAIQKDHNWKKSIIRTVSPSTSFDKKKCSGVINVESGKSVECAQIHTFQVFFQHYLDTVMNFKIHGNRWYHRKNYQIFCSSVGLLDHVSSSSQLFSTFCWEFWSYGESEKIFFRKKSQTYLRPFPLTFSRLSPCLSSFKSFQP